MKLIDLANHQAKLDLLDNRAFQSKMVDILYELKMIFKDPKDSF